VYTIRHEVPILHAIFLAGGFTRFAAPGRITILRENGRDNGPAAMPSRQKQRLRVDADRIARDPQEHPDPTLQAGDVVVVPQTLF
jgi:protein involved in polysaccharide export with SLBB domain